MAPAPLQKTALIKYFFAHIEADGQDGPPAGALDYMSSVWRACGQLQMCRPVEIPAATQGHIDQALATDFSWPPMSAGDDDIHLLAAIQRPAEPPMLYQALEFMTHDSLVIAVLLAPNREHDSLESWTEMEREWLEVSPQGPTPNGVLGEVTLLTALANAPADKITDALEREIRAWYEAMDRSDASVEGALRTEDDLCVCGLERSARTRTVAIFAPPERETMLDRWTFWDRSAGVIGLYWSLAHCFLHAAKLWDQQELHREARRALPAKREGVETALNALINLARRPVTSYDIEELASAQSELTEARTNAGGLWMGMTQLRELRQTVEIAVANVSRLMPKAHPTTVTADQSNPVFGHELGIGASLPAQIDHDLVYLSGLQERAREAERLAEMRLQVAAGQQARLQNRLTLLQSTVLGSLLAALTAIGALNADIALSDEDLRLPLAATFAALVLAVPHIVINWPNRYGWFDYFVTALLGGACGWLLASGLNASGPPLVGIALADAALFAFSLGWMERVVAARTRPWLRRQTDSREADQRSP